jgi:hypothetical protein
MAAAAPLSPAAAAAAAVLLLLICAIAMPAAEAQVVVMGAYNETCPQAEDVMFKEMTAIVAEKRHLAGAVLRLFSLDCFVDGCEGSILLDSTPGNTAEKDAPLNRGVRGYEVVDAIKAKLDAACPGVVSCADTLTLAARDSVRLVCAVRIASTSILHETEFVHLLLMIYTMIIHWHGQTKGPFIPLPSPNRAEGQQQVGGRRRRPVLAGPRRQHHRHHQPVCY